MTSRSHRRRADTDLAPPDPDAEPDRLALFRERLASGEYDAVIGRGLRRTLRDAARDASLQEEIGALRVALGRLLTEEENPSRLASGVARLAGVAVQAARLRGNAASGVEEIRNAMLQQLEFIEREYARSTQRDKEKPHDDRQPGGRVPPGHAAAHGQPGTDQSGAGDGL